MAAALVGLLAEGNSLRVTNRLADCSINTVTKLLVDVCSACANYQNKTLRNLPCKRLQCDEIWSFVYSKQKNVPEEKRDASSISTSFVERQNLTIRMSMRRFTRLTNGFSKKIENHIHAVALHFMYYKFGRIHKSLRVTPSMAAGVSDHAWSLDEIAELAN